jgi:hypothetical protein
MNTLCRALIWNACFLELSEEPVVESHAALKALEDMASFLQQATPVEQEAFVRECAAEAGRLRREALPAYSKAAEFITNLPESMGLVIER